MDGSESRARAPASAGGPVSVVVPVRNERENLWPLTRELQAVLDGLGRTSEIVYVDDGSTDGAAEVLEKVCRAHAGRRLVRLDRRHGPAAALNAGFEAARGEVVVTIDASLQTDPKDILQLLKAVDTGVDAACGWRPDRHAFLPRRLLSKLAGALRHLLLGDDLPDPDCPLRAFRAEALRGLRLYRGLGRLLPALVRTEGGSVAMVRVRSRPRAPRAAGRGLLKRLASVWDLLAVRWMRRHRLCCEATEVDLSLPAPKPAAAGPGAAPGGPGSERSPDGPG